MVTIRHERPSDIAAREALLDQCFGGARFAKASERLREGRLPAEGLSFVATDRGVSPARCGCGTCRPVPTGRRCCSARWQSVRTAAAAGSAQP
jgi:hypothetical protein